MKFSSQAVIDHPADRIDLARWLSTMSDRDYQVCSRGHRAAGTFPEGGTFGMVNVECIGGHLLIQHYLAEKAAPDQVVMHSKDTRVYVASRCSETVFFGTSSEKILFSVDVRFGSSTERFGALFIPLKKRVAPLRRVPSANNADQ